MTAPHDDGAGVGRRTAIYAVGPGPTWRHSPVYIGITHPDRLPARLTEHRKKGRARNGDRLLPIAVLPSRRVAEIVERRMIAYLLRRGAALSNARSGTSGSLGVCPHCGSYCERIGGCY